ncbi:MAG: 8-oxo-dGTP diphosphatase MutT [Planctomycetes bacterium]|nr:8-oxo-dGTP diphosphatase MutT [Planctomycetota bacterium]
MTSSPQPAKVSIAVGLIREAGRFLVARRPAGAHAGGTWELPGGKVRPGEPIEEALRREVEEETGVKVKDGVLLHVEEHAYPDRTVVLHFFLCRGAEGRPEGREGQEVRWVTLEELAALPVPEANRRFLGVLSEQFGEG